MSEVRRGGTVDHDGSTHAPARLRTPDLGARRLVTAADDLDPVTGTAARPAP